MNASTTNAAIIAPPEGIWEQSAPLLELVPPAPQEELLPKTLSGLFDEAFDLYKRHFTTLALCVAVIFLPALLCFHAAAVWLRPLELLADSHDETVSNWAGFQVFFGGLGMAAFLLLALLAASGPATVAVAELYQGRTISIREAYRRAGSYLVRLVLHGIVTLLGGACIAAITLFAGAFLFGLTTLALGNEVLAPLLAVSGIVFLMLLPYLSACLLTAWYFLLAPALTILEKLPLGGLTERNTLLIRRPHWRRAWLAAIFLPLVTIGLQILIYYAAQSLLAIFHLSPSFEFVAQSGITALSGFLLQPYWIIFLTLLYFDCRIRREGIDVTRMADAAGLPHPTGPIPGSPALSVPLTVYNISYNNGVQTPVPMQPTLPTYAGQSGVFYVPQGSAAPAPERRPK